MSPNSARPHPSDDALPVFSHLLHERVPGPVAAVYDVSGTTIEDISRVQVSWSPGQSGTLRYRIEGNGGELAGRRDLVAMVGSIPDGAAVVAGPDGDVGMWVVPNDPLLPGLPSALHRPTVARLLSGLGSSEEVAGTRLRSYRPGRRAVVEVGAGNSSIFLKVVPPSEAGDLHERHRFLTGRLPVPDSLGVSPDLGIVALRVLPGLDLRTVLRRGETAPDPWSIVGIADALPEPVAAWNARSPIRSVSRTVDLLSRLVPDRREQLERLMDDIGDEDVTRRVPVHGDFHEAQVIVNEGHPTGLLDVDTYGWGRPGDDAATMLGHLHLLAPSCESPPEVMKFAAVLNRHWDASHDAADLRLRTAAVVLGLATGPFRVQSPEWAAETRERIDAAVKWVDSARRVDERSLIPASAQSHTAVRS